MLTIVLRIYYLTKHHVLGLEFITEEL